MFCVKSIICLEIFTFQSFNEIQIMKKQVLYTQVINQSLSINFLHSVISVNLDPLNSF